MKAPTTSPSLQSHLNQTSWASSSTNGVHQRLLPTSINTCLTTSVLLSRCRTYTSFQTSTLDYMKITSRDKLSSLSKLCTLSILLVTCPSISFVFGFSRIHKLVACASYVSFSLVSWPAKNIVPNPSFLSPHSCDQDLLVGFRTTSPPEHSLDGVSLFTHVPLEDVFHFHRNTFLFLRIFHYSHSSICWI